MLYYIHYRTNRYSEYNKAYFFESLKSNKPDYIVSVYTHQHSWLNVVFLNKIKD